jgi:muramoyltetrapeptide carboxypeptidase
MVGVDMADRMDQFTEELLWRTLTSTRKIGRIPLPDPAPSVLSPGRSVGRLFGGNLSLIISILGTRFQPDFRGAVLFMEDIGEEPYRIDRMLAQLKNAGILSRVNAILTGQFTDCLPKDPAKPSLTVDQLLLQCAEDAEKPFLSNVPFGHDARKMTIPVGIKARVDTGTGTIEYLESAVR